MPYYPPEVVAKAKEIDLLTYLKNFEPEELVHISRGEYATKTHDSLKISNGKWHWFSREIGGKTALEYLIQVKELSFMEAMQKLVGQGEYHAPVFTSYEQKRKTDMLILPKKASDTSLVKRYLDSRGIDENIIQECIDNGLIYQQAIRNNAVFVGFDEYKNPRYAFIRGIGSGRFMQEATGSDKAHSFKIESDNTDTIHLFESAIDLLSYATLNKKWYEDTLISLAGVYKPKSDIYPQKIPAAVDNYLKGNSQIKRIVLHLDNDEVGKKAAAFFQSVLGKRYEVMDEPPKEGKDFNEYLCIVKGIRLNKNDERSSERTL